MSHYGLKCISQHLSVFGGDKDVVHTSRGYEAWCGEYDKNGRIKPRIYNTLNEAYIDFQKWRSHGEYYYLVEEMD